MSRTLDIDDIVKRILHQLQTPSATAVSTPKPAPAPASATIKQTAQSLPAPLLHDQVITASVLEDRFRRKPITNLRISDKAILTPAAVDFAKDKGLTLIRHQAGQATSTQTTTKPAGSSAEKVILTITQADWANNLLKSVAKSATDWNTRLADGFDQAIELLSTDLSRAAIEEALVVTDRAAELCCLLNRNQAIRAVVLNGILEMGLPESLSPNVWCWQPVEGSFMETRKLLQQVLTSSPEAVR